MQKVEKKFGKYAWQCFFIAVALTVFFYLLQLGALVIRFSEFPNYMNFHSWHTNVIHIFESTPSLKDSFFIAKDEWILEVGYMNFDFGRGISEWSLFVVPAKVVMVLVVNMILVANFRLLTLMRKTQACGAKKLTMGSVFGGLGATFFSVTSITMSWVVCCSTPTWVVGLAILGLGVSTSLWLEPLGLWLNILGIGLLMLLLVVQFRYLQKNTYEFSEA